MESAKLLSQAAVQLVKFGPLLNLRVGYFSLAALPQGLVPAGAACSATTVDNDDAKGEDCQSEHAWAIRPSISSLCWSLMSTRQQRLDAARRHCGCDVLLMALPGV